jgi:hypothetical protein
MTVDDEFVSFVQPRYGADARPAARERAITSIVVGARFACRMRVGAGHPLCCEIRATWSTLLYCTCTKSKIRRRRAMFDCTVFCACVAAVSGLHHPSPRAGREITLHSLLHQISTLFVLPRDQSEPFQLLAHLGSGNPVERVATK